MRPITGDCFTIEHRWKEESVYWEADDGFVFDGGWGVDPPVLYVPSESVWAEVMPEWLRGRRDEVVGRLEACSGHRIVEDVHGYYRNGIEARILRG